jgi:hypothetical protein
VFGTSRFGEAVLDHEHEIADGLVAVDHHAATIEAQAVAPNRDHVD